MLRNNAIALVTHFSVGGILWTAIKYGGIQAMQPGVGNFAAFVLMIMGLLAFFGVGLWELQNQKSYREDLVSVISVIIVNGAVFLYLYVRLYLFYHGHLKEDVFMSHVSSLVWLNFSDIMLPIWYLMWHGGTDGSFWSANGQLSMIAIASVVPSALLWLGLQWKRSAST